MLHIFKSLMPLPANSPWNENTELAALNITKNTVRDASGMPILLCGPALDATLAAYEHEKFLKGSYLQSMAIVRVGEKSYAGEITLPNGTTVVAKISDNGKAEGIHLNGEQNLGSITGLNTANANIETITLLLTLAAFHSKERNLGICEPPEKKPDRISAEEANALVMLSHNLATDAEVLTNVGQGSVTLLAQAKLKNGVLQGMPVLGKPKILKIAKEFSKAKKFDNFGAAYALPEFEEWRNNHPRTPEEELFIPKFDAAEPVMEEAVRIGLNYIHSKDMRRPMKNFMWRGITSYGKSTGVKQLAALLGTPLLIVTCSSTMEIKDFLTDFVPAQQKAEKLPSLNDILYTPDEAYQMMTGEEKRDVTSEEVFELVKNASTASSGPAFKLVESQLVKAMRKGWICEVQEASRIRDAGVLVGLNEYDRPGAVIPLADGTFTKRHEDALVVYTDNVGYASCRPLDPSVLRRFSLIIDSTAMTEQQVLERIHCNVPEFTDATELQKMYTTWVKIQEHLRHNDITDGTCSVSELEMWVEACVLDETRPFENCVECVVSKCTSDPEEQQRIIDSVLKANGYEP